MCDEDFPNLSRVNVDMSIMVMSIGSHGHLHSAVDLLLASTPKMFPDSQYLVTPVF